MRLLPCPWCGCEMEVREHAKFKGAWRFYVEHIMFEGGPDCPFPDCAFRERSVEQAVTAWNTRAPVPVPGAVPWMPR